MQSEILIAKLFMKTAFSNKAVFILTLFIGLLLIFATFTGWTNFKNQNEMKAKYQEQSRKDWLSNPNKHPHRMAHYGNFAFRPKAPLSVFDFGMESFFGNSIYLEAHKQNSTNFSEAGFSTGLLRFGEISIAMILQILLPLLIFFLGFSSIASERENGTLKILLSQGLSWKQLILGKSYGLIGVIMTLFIPLMMVISIIWVTIQGDNINSEEILRLVLIILSYFVYLSIFCVIAVLVSAVSKTSKTALTSLIGLWLMLTIVLPRASQALGKAIYEAPSKAKFESAIDADVTKVGDSHNPNDPYFKSLKDSVLAVYKVDSVKKLPFNYSGFQMKEGEKISANIYQKHQNRLLAIYEKQNSFSKIVAFFNPFMAIKNLSMSLSNTDFSSYVDFQAQAEAYRYHMTEELNDLQMKYISNDAKSSAGTKNIIDKKHWEDLHDFQYKSARISKVFQNDFISILALLFWIGLLLFFISYLSKNLKAI
jgi:ABC-2 type transport system permease protein